MRDSLLVPLRLCWFLVSSLAAAVAAAAVAAALTADVARPPQSSLTTPAQHAASASFPSFSWATVPVFLHCGNSSGPFGQEALQYIAQHSFPLVTIEKMMAEQSVPVSTDAEDKIIAAAKQVRQHAPASKILFYLNSVMDWSMYNLHQRLLHEQGGRLLLHDSSGELIRLVNQTVFDLSLPDMQRQWVDVLRNATASGVIDGAFADRATEAALPAWHLSPEKATAYAEGHAAMLRAAQQAMGAKAPFIANNGDVSGVTGRMFERWAHGDFDNHANLSTDIANLQAEAAAGRIAEVHGGEPCSPHFFNLSLAAFLVGAGEYAYYACTEGWECDSGWLTWHEEYDWPLGKPLSDAHVKVVDVDENGDVFRQEATTTSSSINDRPAVRLRQYKRAFASGTHVTLNVGASDSYKDAVGCIYWANGHVTGPADVC